MGAEEVFTLPLPSLNLDWLKSTRMFASRFDIHLHDGKFRFYLNPPGNDAPRPDPEVLQTISAALGQGSGIALTHGPSGMVSDDLVTNVLDSGTRSLNYAPETAMRRYCGNSSTKHHSGTDSKMGSYTAVYLCQLCPPGR